ncbi:MAG TPA: hypothetical protein VGK10_20705 [Prolixibacteraceae bacterium]
MVLQATIHLPAAAAMNYFHRFDFTSRLFFMPRVASLRLIHFLFQWSSIAARQYASVR